uniref:Acyl transferase domain-containing protein n=1 Tax=Candidatus Kentrum sp. SD TaxID=2126332 RepID=A0A450YFU7_9GAMM|nr:MAG: Acyl transferase domain-containing protein [Candidatus Kentron sp. SD]VFK40418.1 MAG: Acyl transferase domain-containing protein [Candidatus Kentron sp. SD]
MFFFGLFPRDTVQSHSGQWVKCLFVRFQSTPIQGRSQGFPRMSDLQNRIEKLSPLQRAAVALEQMQSKLDAVERARNEPIAIIGVGCRFPGADNPDAYWQLLHNGVDAMREVPPERWDVDSWFDPNMGVPGKSYMREAAFLSEVDRFDPRFFGISPREATDLDPQQRLLLEVTWEALENAGLAPGGLVGASMGAFIGCASTGEYASGVVYGDPKSITAYTFTGNSPSVLAGRLSYVLGTQGPTLTMDTACSSSLVALHLACRSLRVKECELAIAGGVNLILSPESMVIMSEMQALSPDGRCKTFDAAADGYGRGEGCGIVVLKRLSDAIADNDNILALIRGSAINHDGVSSGLTVPNEMAQERVIRQALDNANLTPADVSYIEAHGTGTPLGDPIEIGALDTVFTKDHSADFPLIVGSVKTNFGHLEGAAGIAGLIKIVLGLQHEEIPPHLHFRAPNPFTDWEKLPFQVPIEGIPWPHNEKPRVAGVSSFGASGTNAHVVLEEAPIVGKESTGEAERPCHLLTLSAKSDAALQDLMRAYGTHLQSHPDLSLANACFTANVGRTHFNHRLAVVADSPIDAEERLRAGNYTTGKIPHGKPKIAFLFTGQGSQYAYMGQQLYKTQPVFRETIDRCDALLRPDLEIPLLELLYPESEASGAVRLNETKYTQPALFSLEVALAGLWQSWGVMPDAVMGHSVGEYVAACVAGVFSLEDGLKLIAARGRLMQTLCERGDMLALPVDERKAMEIIAPFAPRENDPGISIAAINGPSSVVVSGTHQAMGFLLASLADSDIKAKSLSVSHAFHSRMMGPMLDEFGKIAQSVIYERPLIPLCSNVTGKIITDEVTGPDYWVRHIREPVRFAAGMETLREEGFDAFLEIGPKPALLGMARQCLPDDAAATWLPSLRQDQEDWRQLLQTLGEWYVRGGAVDWAGFDQDYPRHKVVLPTYPFQRQRYWFEKAAIEASKRAALGSSIHPLLGRRLDLADADDRIRFEAQIDLWSVPYLIDHRVFDTVVVPGTAYLEMGLAAGRAVSDQPFRIEEVTVEQALVLSEEGTTTVQVVLSPEEEGYRFRIFSLGAESHWILHSGGRLLFDEVKEPPAAIDLTRLQAECPEELSIADHYLACQEHGLNYGPAFQGVRQLFRGEGLGLGRIELSESFAYQANDHHLHPALLDAAFQTIMATLPESSGSETYLPTGVRELHVYGDAGTRIWGLARIVEVNERIILADISLFDDAGAPIAQVNGYTIAYVNPETLQHHFQKRPNDLYEIVWQTRPLELTNDAAKPMGDEGPGYWLIFADWGDAGEGDAGEGGLGRDLAKRLGESGDARALVYAGAAYENKGNDVWIVDPTEPGDFGRLLSDVLAEGSLPLKGIVHLWGLDTPSIDLTTEILEQTQRLTYGSVLHLLRAQIEQEKSAKLWLVTRNAVKVGQAGPENQPPLAIAQASAWGLGKSIGLEYPNLWGGLIDNPEVADLLAEIRIDDKEDQVAYRNGQRYVARVVESGINVAGKAPFSAEDSYLITGGLGALGSRFGRWMVTERGVRYLVLTGRRAPSEEAGGMIREMEEAGAKVLVVSADVSKEADAARLFEEIDAGMPPLKGIIHAAGVLDDGILAQQTFQRFERVSAPKIAATWNLHTLSRERDLDFFVCFSTIASLMGAAGQANYAAANAFMDAFVHFRHDLGLPVLGINWGAWADFGLAAEMAQQKRDRLLGFGINVIDMERGALRLDALMGQSKGIQVIVAPMDWSRFLQQFPVAPPLLSALTRDVAPTVGTVRIKSQLSEAPEEEHEAILIDYIRNGIANVLKTNPDELDVEQPLNTMGLDSLMAIELKNRIRMELDVDIPIATLMEDIGITGFARKIKVMVGEVKFTSTLSTDSASDSEEEILAKLESGELSDEEIDSLFNEHFSEKNV